MDLANSVAVAITARSRRTRLELAARRGGIQAPRIAQFRAPSYHQRGRGHWKPAHGWKHGHRHHPQYAEGGRTRAMGIYTRPHADFGDDITIIFAAVSTDPATPTFKEWRANHRRTAIALATALAVAAPAALADGRVFQDYARVEDAEIPSMSG